MIAISRKPRLPLKWHGGKSYLARRIIALMPRRHAYAEHFAGGMAVGLNLQPPPVHLANDADADLMNFWVQLRDAGDNGLVEAIRATEYTPETFFRAVEDLKPGETRSPLRRAFAFLIVRRMSRDGLGEDFSWSDRLRGKTRAGGPFPENVNAWETMVEGLPRVVDRLASVRLTCREALESIREADEEFGPDVVHYCDPPYLHSTRTHRRAYDFEMDDDQHRAMLETLRAVRGVVLLSGYPNPLYEAELVGWRRVEFEMPNHSGQGKKKQRRVECIWINRP
jgi:DNA adenine methylase